MPDYELRCELILRALKLKGDKLISKSGTATSELHKLSRIEIGRKGFSLILDQMEADGLIVREMTPKRTYAIAISPDLPEKFTKIISKPLPSIEVHRTIEPEPELIEQHPVVAKIMSLVEDQIESMQDTIDNLQQELDETRTKMTRYQEGYMPIKQQRDNLSDELQAKLTEIRGLRQRLREAEDHVRIMEQQHKEAVQRAVQEARRNDLDRIMREPPKARSVGD